MIHGMILRRMIFGDALDGDGFVGRLVGWSDCRWVDRWIDGSVGRLTGRDSSVGGIDR